MISLRCLTLEVEDLNSKENRPLLIKRKMSLTIMIIGFFVLTSCVGSSPNGKRSKRSGGGTDNSGLTVSVGYGRMLASNPIILSGDSNLDPETNLGIFLSSGQDFITFNQFLIGACEDLQTCFQVKKESNAGVLQTDDGKWAFDTNSDEFLQVHTFGHVQKILKQFHEQLKFIHNYSQPSVPSTDLGFNYYSSIPQNLYNYGAYWKPGKTLSVHSDSGLVGNAQYQASDFVLSFGHIDFNENVKFAEDPSVIYHETGHALIDIMLNLRNIQDPNSVTPDLRRADMGYRGYDEAASMGEGIADFFSYYVNKRTHFGEWALGRFYNESRPLSERDPIHAAGIEAQSDSRLSYPDFLTYNANRPEQNVEDVHYAGQILSHYLVAVVEDLESSCAMSKDTAIFYVMYVLTETLAELGDLSSTGSDLFGNYTNNLDKDNSLTWLKSMRPITYRNFAQTFAKKQLNILGSPSRNLCNNGVYTTDKIETLLDNYGLLLFKNYNQDGNNESFGHTGTNKVVASTNRSKSDLIKKKFLKLDPSPNATVGFIFDDQVRMHEILGNLKQYGRIKEISSQIESDLPYNNNNNSISPGEFVGLMLNIYNDSNTTMAGVQFIASDWDHMKNGEPCNTFDDQFPLAQEGAADLTSGEGTPGGCDYITRTNGKTGTDKVEPVCFMQLRDTVDGELVATKWVSQETFRTNMGLEKSKCLGGQDDTMSCFLRSPEGADTAYFSKIAPKSTWAKTLADENGSPTIKTGNLIFFEVSPWIPPGTIFNCRFRATFSNCEDCYNDETNNQDDFLDYEFSGSKPFKLINFKFTVVD